MRLSGILPETTKIIRDGTFSSLGTLFSRQPDHVVYATRDSDVAKIRENPSITCVITTPALASAISPNIGYLSVIRIRVMHFSYFRQH